MQARNRYRDDQLNIGGAGPKVEERVVDGHARPRVDRGASKKWRWASDPGPPGRYSPSCPGIGSTGVLLHLP
jgi:hypothetical protein